MDSEQRLRDLYVAFNARDMETVLGAMSDDVDWPNAWEGGRLHGRDAVRDYWTRQWAEIDPRVKPVAISFRDDGRAVVDVAQTVRSLEGELIGEGRGLHVYELHDGLITRMDVEEEPAQPG